MRGDVVRAVGICLCALLALAVRGTPPALAQTDEIQVYDASIVERGQFGLTWHNNYTPSGRTSADFPGGIVPNHAYNGVPEFAYGVRDWLEVGAYLPVYTFTNDGRVLFDSAKLRALFVVPQADKRSFFYGVNFELSYNARHWEAHRISGEIRPIIGWRFGPIDFIVNPILDTGFDGVSHLDFAPCVRLAYNISETWAIAAEHYADFGELRHFETADNQSHTVFAVVDHRIRGFDIEFGAGHGLTPASDSVVLKLMISHTL